VKPVPEVKHGEVSYLQIPARDIAESARFYGEVFGWTFVSDYPGSFDTPSGLIGSLQTDLPVASAGGTVLWLFVTDIHQALQHITKLGGRIVEDVTEEGPRLQATFGDPAGNVLGAWQDQAI
jgi:uncharacterized protein